MKFLLLLVSLPCFCLSSDKSDRSPSINHDNVTNNIHVTNSSPLYSPRPPARPSKITRPGPKHSAVEAAHEEARRQQEEDDFITCCCFFKIKKLPLH